MTHRRRSVGRDDLEPSIMMYMCDLNISTNNLQIK